LIVQRKGDPRKSTLEACGLVDGQPTGKHFQIRIYDEIVVQNSVTTPEMIQKTTEAFRLSDNLGAEGGTLHIVGTKYHFNDTYSEIERQGIARPRVHAC